jgi:hypothetical protein
MSGPQVDEKTLDPASLNDRVSCPVPTLVFAEKVW